MSVHYFEMLEEDGFFYLTHSDKKILTNCGKYYVSNPNKELINFIIDDFDRCFDLKVKNDYVDTNILCAYNLFSLQRQMIEHPQGFTENINHWLYYDEIFYQTGNGPPLEIEQISRLAAPREALASLFGYSEIKKLYQYGLAQFYHRQKIYYGEDISDSPEDWEGPGILITKEQYALNITVIKMREAINNLPLEKKAAIYQLHEMSEQSSILITFLLVQGLISKQQYASAMLANRLEAIDGYLPDVTALDQYEASMEIMHASTSILDYLSYFNSINDDILSKVLALIQNHESKSVEFKSSFFLCQKTNNKLPIIMAEAAKAIAGFMNGKGGNLLIGVSDDKKIIGLKSSEGKYFKDIDSYTQSINQYLGKCIGKIALNKLTIDFVEISEMTVCLITCPFYTPTYFTDLKYNKLKGWPETEEVFFLRQEKQTDKLSSKETIDYLKSIGKI